MSGAREDESDPLRARYEAWVHSYARDLYRYSYRLTGRADSAEEIVQETFVQAWRHRESLRDAGAVRSWLFTICRNTASRSMRNRATQRVISGALGMTQARQQGTGTDADEMTLDSFPSADPHHENRIADRDALQRGLDALDESVRLPFVMVFIEGKSCRDTATEMGIPFGTVLSRLSRAREHLRRVLSRSYDFTAKERRKRSPTAEPESASAEEASLPTDVPAEGAHLPGESTTR